MHVSAVMEIRQRLLPQLTALRDIFQVRTVHERVKIGRTHLMDDMTVGQEFSGT